MFQSLFLKGLSLFNLVYGQGGFAPSLGLHFFCGGLTDMDKFLCLSPASLSFVTLALMPSWKTAHLHSPDTLGGPAQWECSQWSSSCRGLRGWWRPAVTHPSNINLWQTVEMQRRSRPNCWPAASLLERGGGLESWWEQRETPEKGAGMQFCLEPSQRTGHSDAWAVFLEGGQGKVKSCPTFSRF